MFYQFMKWYLGWMIKLHFRFVFSRGLDKIPDGQPVIFASNHPAGFTEPIILATNVKQPIHFLVLGSFLTAKWLKWFFNGVKMVPIYRRDIAGDKSIEKNIGTFQYVYDSLEKNSHILIYPEAKTHFIYKVRPLRKGIARMANGFLKNQTHDYMYIVPVGSNFIYPGTFRSDVFIDIGDPIKIDLSDDDGDEKKWLKKVVDITSEGMKKVVFNVEDEERHAIIQDLVEIQKESRLSWRLFPGKSYKRNENLVASINEYVDFLGTITKQQFKQLEEQLDILKNELKKRKLSFRYLFRNGKHYILRAIILFLTFPLFLLGVALHGISLLISNYVRKNLVKRLEYKAAVASAVPTVLTFLGTIALLIIATVFHPLFYILMLVFPLSLYFLIYYYDFANSFYNELKFRALSKEEKNRLKEQVDAILSFGK